MQLLSVSVFRWRYSVILQVVKYKLKEVSSTSFNLSVDRRLEDFRKSRMGMDYTLEFFKSRFASDQSTCFLDYVRCMRAEKMAAKDTARLIW